VLLKQCPGSAITVSQAELTVCFASLTLWQVSAAGYKTTQGASLAHK